ncbi:MAG: hypothetical protein MHPSP_002250 [Paramarteilia canceri]
MPGKISFDNKYVRALFRWPGTPRARVQRKFDDTYGLGRILGPHKWQWHIAGPAIWTVLLGNLRSREENENITRNKPLMIAEYLCKAQEMALPNGLSLDKISGQNDEISQLINNISDQINFHSQYMHSRLKQQLESTKPFFLNLQSKEIHKVLITKTLQTFFSKIAHSGLKSLYMPGERAFISDSNAKCRAVWKRIGWLGHTFKAHNAKTDHIGVQSENILDFALKTNMNWETVWKLNFPSEPDEELWSSNFLHPFNPTTLGLICRVGDYFNYPDPKQATDNLLKHASLVMAAGQTISEAHSSIDFLECDYDQVVSEKEGIKDIDEPRVAVSIAANSKTAVFTLFQLNTVRMDLSHDLNRKVNFYTQIKVDNLFQTNGEYAQISQEFIRTLNAFISLPKLEKPSKLARKLPISLRPDDLEMPKEERIYYYMNL